MLTASIYNSDHTNHVTNLNPTMTGAYSDNVAQMQANTDPGGVGSESLAASLAGEIERLRFAIKRLIGKAQWYIAPATDLEAINANNFVTTPRIADNAVTYAKLQDASATLRILARRTAGAGDYEENTLSQILDFIGSAAQGDILTRGAAAWARLAAGSAGQLLQSQGAGADLIWAASPADRQEFNGSGTWNKPAVGTVAFIQCWGGGGSGGRAGAGDGGGGGAGGAYAERWMALSALGSSETVTIGAGGAAQTVDNTNGNVGGNTTFGSVHVAAGGGGAGSGTAADNGGGGGGGPGQNGGSSAAGASGGPGASPAGTIGGVNTSSANNSNPFGGAGGGSGGATGSPGGHGIWGGGGGGAGDDVASPGVGGISICGGGGGGGGADSTAGAAGGLGLIYGGNGGAGAIDAVNATAGTAPGGGGGGSETGNSGAGAAGRIVVTVI